MKTKEEFINDMETTNIQEVFNKGEHLSTNLLDQLLLGIEIPEDNPYPAIAGILLLTQFIDKLGWIEHTSDWDLNMIIETKDGKHYETGFGYGTDVQLWKGRSYNMELKHLEYLNPEQTKDIKLVFDHTKFDDPDLKSWSINIHNIKSISFDK